MRSHISLSSLAVVLLAFAAAAQADTLTLTFTQTVFNVTAGSNFVLSGTLSQSDPRDLEDVGVIAAIPCGPTDCFATNFDPALLAYMSTTSNNPSANLTLYSGPMLDVFILASALPGQTGTIQMSATALDVTDPAGTVFLLTPSIPIQVNIVDSQTPEPATWLLMGSALPALGWLRRRR